MDLQQHRSQGCEGPPSALGISLIVALGLFAPRGVRAQHSPRKANIEACFQAHEQAQLMRRQGFPLAERNALQRCGQPGCPRLIRNDCVGWLPDAQKKVPSVVFWASVDGRETNYSRVLVDGEVVREALDGKPDELEPGRHEVRFQRAPMDDIVLEVLVATGQKNRVIRAEFSTHTDASARSSGDAATSPTRSATSTPGDLAPPRSTPRPTPTGTYVWMASTAVTTALGLGLGIRAKNKRDDLLECKPNCASSEVDSVRTRLVVADISFGLAAVSALAAVISYVRRPQVGAEDRASSRSGAQGNWRAWWAAHGRIDLSAGRSRASLRAEARF